MRWGTMLERVAVSESPRCTEACMERGNERLDAQQVAPKRNARLRSSGLSARSRVVPLAMSRNLFSCDCKGVGWRGVYFAGGVVVGGVVVAGIE